MMWTRCLALAAMALLCGAAPQEAPQEAREGNEPVMKEKVALKGNENPVEGGKQKASSDLLSKPLISHPVCAKDIEAALMSRRCTPSKQYQNNFALIACLTNVVPESTSKTVNVLSDKCQHVIWDYKKAITNNPNFLKEIEEACPDDRDHEKLEGCANFASDQGTQLTRNGHILSCIIEKKNAFANSKNPGGFVESCALRITQIESVVFSDYRLIGDFVDKCNKDIQTLQCGRILENEESYHSQGKVIECLSSNVTQLRQVCKAEILKIAEYQSDDYHLDRSLFLACKSDRERICGKVKSGEGRVYKCLMELKFSPEMTKQCRNQLLRRQRLMAEDYKVSRGLARMCRQEIENNQCRDQVNKEDHVTVKLSQILLCLETSWKAKEEDNQDFSAQCLQEMKEHRRMLMEDYRISPEIVQMCKEDIKDLCGDNKSGGKTLHCLMRSANNRKLTNVNCVKAIANLLKETDVAQNWKVDPLLQKNCQEVVDTACDAKGSPEDVMNCLLNLKAKGSRVMTKDCSNTLQEIQYFMARDFTLHPKLYQKCRHDARKLCDATSDWFNDDVAGKNVFPCLVRYLYIDEDEDPNDEIDGLSEDCAEQVEKALERRAISVKLHPEIEDACRGFLIEACVSQTEKGQELNCLQENLEELENDWKECHEAVVKYTKVEARNIRLNPLVSAACHDVIDHQCKDETSKKSEGKVMHCLIQFKLDHPKRVNPKCSVVIEHWQILSLKNWKFSSTFKKMCTDDVKTLCRNSDGEYPKTKSEVIQCLSTFIQVDLVEEREPQRVSQGCQNEIKFQLLQKHSNIKLNPKLVAACQPELETLCSDRMTLECLKDQKHDDLSARCRHVVFKQEKEEVTYNKLDTFMTKTCANEISRHCQNEEGENAILNCLKEHQADVNFDPKCRRVVIKRIIQQMKDFRLNPRLAKACSNDLPKFCHQHILEKVDSEKDFLEGKVIQCLKDKFVENENKLTLSCKREVENILRQASVDIRANPQVVKVCPQSIEQCRSELHVDDKTTLDNGQIEECLKTKFRQKELNKDTPDCITAVAKLIEEESMDIEVDHVLHEACSLDLSKFCRGVSPGSGKQISCLRNVKDDQNLVLEPKCDQVLTKRIEMYNMAIQMVPMASVRDLYSQLSRSPHRNYFLIVIMSFIGIIFVIGLCCGRATKRIKRELKNR